MSQKTVIEMAVQQLRAGNVVGYPTETVWGLAAAPEHLEQLWRRKGREANKPLQVSCADHQTALALAEASPLLELLLPLWPGPLTVVTRASARCPAALAPGGWVGLRLPDHAVAQHLLSAAGYLATTSLNPTGQPAALTFKEARRYALADLLLGQPPGRAGGQASTVVRLPARSGEPAQVLRVGALAAGDLAAVLGRAGVRVEAPS
ncbi:Sua5/YciO/YrdC/YwlC family protein [Deinococcus sp.]|uniref:Sua5/YciO/YrdC/YwlC family protein n=1 Tax=Deinococcus sp. TaxID=47478 RepID=UPI0025BB558F|nr:Sua5/YciO/YrdC/YwlC family protein [Deinococcus sp.]